MTVAPEGNLKSGKDQTPGTGQFKELQAEEKFADNQELDVGKIELFVEDNATGVMFASEEAKMSNGSEIPDIECARLIVKLRDKKKQIMRRKVFRFLIQLNSERRYIAYRSKVIKKTDEEVSWRVEQQFANTSLQ